MISPTYFLWPSSEEETTRTVIMFAMMSLMLVACGEQKQDVKDTVFAPQVEALDKARAVEDTLKQGEQKKRAAIEASENLGQSAY